MLLSNRKWLAAAPGYFHVFFLIAFLKNTFIRYILYYALIIRVNDMIINNSYGRLQNLIFLFKIPMRKQKNFFEIYNLNTPSKRFVRSALRSQMYVYVYTYIFFTI